MSWSSPDPSSAGIVAALEKRSDLLRRLADGPMEKPALRDAMGVSRSTVYKALRELEDLGLVRRGEDGYALTAFGRLARRAHDDYRATIHRLCTARAVVDAVPDDALVPLALVRQGRVVGATRHAPERPMSVYEALAADSARMCVLSPVAVPRYVSRVHERVVERGDLVVELVVTDDAFEYLADANEKWDDLLTADGFSAYRTDREVPFGLTLFDDEAAVVTTYNDAGGLRGVLLSDAPEAVAWGEATVRRHREAATDV